MQNLQRLNQLELLQRLQNLEKMERLARIERLENMDIFDIDYSEFDVVYFDIPYRGTNKYDFEFDYDRFYDFFASLGKPAFLSEYNAPFESVATFDKAQNMAAVGCTGMRKGLEKLYFNGTLDEYKGLMGMEYRPLHEQCQISMFG